jgi:hypothetical protein
VAQKTASTTLPVSCRLGVAPKLCGVFCAPLAKKKFQIFWKFVFCGNFGGSPEFFNLKKFFLTTTNGKVQI